MAQTLIFSTLSGKVGYSDSANLGDHGVKVHKMYGNRFEHTLFVICEADSMEQLDAAFDPILEMGQYTVTPVMERK